MPRRHSPQALQAAAPTFITVIALLLTHTVAAFDPDGVIAYVEQAGKGSGGAPSSFLYIPRGSRSDQDQWDRYTFDIHTIRVDGSDGRRLTTDGLSTGPVWSWDGKWLAYVSGPKPIENLFVVRSDGSGRKRLLEVEESIERYWWSLDSKQILVSVASERGSPTRPTRRGTKVLEGRVINVRTGATGQLSNNEWMRGWNHWAPGKDEVINPRRRLMEALGGIEWPLWSPDAQFIAFLYDGFLALAHAPTVGDNGNWFLMNDEPRASGLIEWSRDGRKILFHGGGASSGTRDGGRGSTGILVADLDGKGYRWGDAHLVSNRHGGGGTFNGDASRVAFLATPPGRMNNEIYVVDVTGDNEARITNSRVNHRDLSWQPIADQDQEPAADE